MTALCCMIATPPIRLMKTRLLILAMLLVPAAVAQPGPYVTVSTGSATFSSSDAGNQTKRRDAVCAGYAVSDLIALEVSYFQIQEAKYSPDNLSLLFTPSYHSIEGREKINGFAFGPVFRWRLSERVTVFTKQSAVSIQIDQTTVYNTGPSSNWNSTTWGYQPSVGLDFRVTSKTPLSLGLELNRVLTTSGRIKDITGILVNLSYGF
jgi:hypothetical protein